MHKCSMQKPETENQTFLLEVNQQEIHNIQGNIKILLRRYCEDEKIMRFYKDIDIFEEI